MEEVDSAGGWGGRKGNCHELGGGGDSEVGIQLVQDITVPCEGNPGQQKMKGWQVVRMFLVHPPQYLDERWICRAL